VVLQPFPVRHLLAGAEGQVAGVAHEPPPPHRTSHEQASPQLTPAPQLLAPAQATSHSAPAAHDTDPEQAPSAAQVMSQSLAVLQSMVVRHEPMPVQLT
jgi:hypothetical protein